MSNRLAFLWGQLRTRCRRAFTMVELLVVATIAIGLLLTLLDGWTTAARASAAARQWVIGTNLAREQLDYLCSRPFGEAALTPTPRAIGAKTVGNTSQSTYHFVVHKSPVAGRSDEKCVSVQVSWTEGGLSHHVELETLVYSSGF